MQTLLNIKKEAPFLHAAKDRVVSWREIFMICQREERRRWLKGLCKDYVPTPFGEMTPVDVSRFSARMAVRTTELLRFNNDEISQMTNEERQCYADAVEAAISYFNKRDDNYADFIQYMREVTDQRKAMEARRDEEERKRKHQIVIRVI